MQTLVKFTLAAALLGALAGCGGRKAPPPPAASFTTAPAQPQVTSLNTAITYPKFGDNDPHEWGHFDPTDYPIHGIDVSRWQTDIDWREARRNGVSFVFIKATEGGDHLDPSFIDHWAGARDAGIRHGAYHFYYFCRSPEEQAAWFIRNVPRDNNSMPHVLDMEWNHHSKTCRLRPDGATIRKNADTFLDILQRHYGRRPIIYTTVDFYADTGIGNMRGERFWLRSVAGHPNEVYDGAPWTFWQYTGTGVVPGIKGGVDINVFAGDVLAWNYWLN
ncbi:GH25 family lysozyme [Qingshengfaniella alkalisoli]|uniref:Glycoside hydrolase family 25 protein n=1 Tax=Qingshengfaniella alkalisoli TaxID=2599296 RepID=A0A5B8ITX1_9RHOB|nr:GH25 family lysozyme [Qingshengfaniella alkalisoli]QDY68913.1 glycoside hydrolase family 25 protein [Qingshengfaniella alkalisoli]